MSIHCADSGTTAGCVIIHIMDIRVCRVCGYEWASRAGRLPRRCPSTGCRSMRWQAGFVPIDARITHTVAIEGVEVEAVLDRLDSEIRERTYEPLED